MKPAILICGQTGTGKSSIINFRLRKPVARVGHTAESVRNGFPPPQYENESIVFYDSDGYEINSTESYKENLFGFLSDENSENDIHLVWYTINAAAHRVTPFDKEVIETIVEDFPVALLLTKIDDCDEDSLNEFCNEVSDLIPEIPIFRVSTIHGEVQKYTDWDALVEWTGDMLKTIEILQHLQGLTQQAYSVIENTRVMAGLSAAIPIPLLDSAALIPVLCGMVSKILAVYDLSLNDNVVLHVIKSTWTLILGKTAVRSGLKLIPVVGWFVGAATGGAGNVMITNSLGEATIDLCNEFMFDDMANNGSNRSFEDIFTSGDFEQAVKNHMESKSSAA